MIRPISRMGYLGFSVMMLLAHAVGPSCQAAKPPPSPKALAFSREVQSVINQIGPPMAGPIARKDREAVQAALARAFSACTEECQGLLYSAFILDQQWILIAVYPSAEVKQLALLKK